MVVLAMNISRTIHINTTVEISVTKAPSSVVSTLEISVIGMIVMI